MKKNARTAKPPMPAKVAITVPTNTPPATPDQETERNPRATRANRQVTPRPRRKLRRSAPGTAVHYTLAATSNVTVTVYNPGGRVVREVHPGRQAAGTHEYFWDGRNDGGRRVTPGIYYCEVNDGSAAATRTMVRLR